MKPLRVLLIHRDSDRYRQLTGWWSYPVSEFTWQAVKVPALGFHVQVPGGFDLAVLDDWIWGTVEKGGIRLAYVIVDSARSPAQLDRNRNQARQADLILVDSDRLRNFANLGKPVRRFAYAVNEQLFHPRHKEYDVAFLCWPTPPRRVIQEQVEKICLKRGWSFLTGTYAPQEYAAAIGSAKVVVHKAHVEQARSWRVFDVMASRGCLLSSPLPIIDGDGIVKGVHYAEYRDEAELERELERLLSNETWAEMAEMGFQHVMEHHTWATRARELREMLNKELGL